MSELRTPKERLKLLEKKLRKEHRWIAKNCPICNSKDRRYFDYCYTNWNNEKKLLAEFSVTKLDVESHAIHAGLDSIKFYNTEVLYKSLIELGMEPDNVKNLQIRAKDVIAAAKQLDALNGRVIQKVEKNESRTVAFVSIPAPGGVVAPLKAEEKPALKGVLLPALPAALSETKED